MSQIVCSTGALIGRPNNRDYRLLKSFAGQLRCDGFEFMMYSSWYDEMEALVATLQDLQLNIPVMHCEKHIGEIISQGDFAKARQLFTINCRIAQQLGAKKLVIHLWDGMTSDRNIENNIMAYGELAGIAGEFDLELLVENVVCNHENPMKHWCTLAENYPEIRFVFDTKMAAFHEQLELLYDEEYAWLWKEKHITHYHVNDYAGGYLDWKNLRTLPIGRGHIDFDRFFIFLKKIGYDGSYTVEATAFNAEGRVDVEMLNGCFDRIHYYLNRRNYCPSCNRASTPAV